MGEVNEEKAQIPETEKTQDIPEDLGMNTFQKESLNNSDDWNALEIFGLGLGGAMAYDITKKGLPYLQKGVIKTGQVVADGVKSSANMVTKGGQPVSHQSQSLYNWITKTGKHASKKKLSLNMLLQKTVLNMRKPREVIFLKSAKRVKCWVE